MDRYLDAFLREPGIEDMLQIRSRPIEALEALFDFKQRPPLSREKGY